MSLVIYENIFSRTDAPTFVCLGDAKEDSLCSALRVQPKAGKREVGQKKSCESKQSAPKYRKLFIRPECGDKLSKPVDIQAVTKFKLEFQLILQFAIVPTAVCDGRE